MQASATLIKGLPITERWTKPSPISARGRQLRLACAARADMNVLVIGSGGREHALAWKMAQSTSCDEMYVAPGNAGTQLEPNMTTLPNLNPSNHKAVIDFCKEKKVGFVVVGPEQPLVEGCGFSYSCRYHCFRSICCCRSIRRQQSFYEEFIT